MSSSPFSDEEAERGERWPPEVTRFAGLGSKCRRPGPSLLESAPYISVAPHSFERLSWVAKYIYNISFSVSTSFKSIIQRH